MSFDILLDSSLAKLQIDGERNVSHDFTVNFYPPIDLGSGNYKAALNRLITMSYSWNNIDALYNNNKIRWRKKSKEWKTLTFPNGMYDYQRINTFLQKHIGKVDPADKDSDYIFTMYFDMSVYRVVISMHENYELDFSQGAFAELLGYEEKLLTGKKAMLENSFQISQEVLIGCICTAILSHADQTMFQAMCYTVSQQQGFRLAIHFKKSRVSLSGNL